VTLYPIGKVIYKIAHYHYTWKTPDMNNTLIYANGVAKFFGSIPALKSLSLEVPEGISGFIGANGAGKTTTINILLGLLKPDAGQAQVFGMDCWHDSYKIRRRLGILHEKPAYPGNFTGQRYLEHVARLYSVNQPNQRVQELLKEVDMTKAKDRPIKTYSAGMTQRLGLAQALIGDPELAILDEPTANLDPMGRIEFLEKIKTLHEEKGVSFFISTHILPELEKICEYVSIVDEGRTVDQGTVKFLSEKYSATIYKIETPNPQLLASHIKKLESVDDAWVQNNMVLCKVSNTKKFSSQLPKLASDLNVGIDSFQPLHSTLEEIFKVVSGREKG